MKPSSSSSEGLFDAVLGRGAAVSDVAWLTAMLRVESALVRALADCGVVPSAAADAIEAACSASYDIGAIGAAAAETGNPVVPLVAAIRARLPDDVAQYVHHGATSQDVIDTAMMLVARSAGIDIVADLRVCADSAAALAAEHRDHPVLGRTLMQAAVPTTFGLTAATWTVGLDAVAGRLATVLSALPAQLGGAVGTLAAIAEPATALEVGERFASSLGLLASPVAWHTIRVPVAELAGALGAAGGIVGKVALDLVLLAEGGEVREGVPGRGGSSTMPHKQNPVAAISARAASIRTPGLVATLLACMAQEQQRAAGAWHAEWETLSDLLRVCASGAAWLADSLGHLVVDVDRMRAGAGSGDTGAAGLIVDRVLRGRA